MSVYVDKLMSSLKSKVWRHTAACHMVADTEEELFHFAQSIGLRRCWYQVSKGGLGHYDLTSGKRKQAVKAGAVEISYLAMARDFIRPAQILQIRKAQNWSLLRRVQKAYRRYEAENE